MIIFARGRGKYNKIRSIDCTSTSEEWLAGQQHLGLGGNREMNTGVTQLQPCLVPQGWVLRSGPTGPLWELSGSHKTTLDFVCLPKDTRESHVSARAESSFSGLRHLLSKEPSSERRQATSLAFWDMDADSLMVMKYSCSVLLNETRCWAGRQLFWVQMGYNSWVKTLACILINSQPLPWYLPVQSVPPQTSGYNEGQLAATSQLVTILLQAWCLKQRRQKDLQIELKSQFCILSSLCNFTIWNC